MKKHHHEAHERAREQAAEEAKTAEKTEAKAENAAEAAPDAAAQEAAPEVVENAPEGATPEEEAQPSPEQVLKDRLLRLQADFDNYKKRQLRDRQDWIASANADILKELLPVVDNFERGLASASAQGEEKAILDGFSLISGQLKGVLAKAGVAEIPTEGQPFDPSLHEALTTMPSADVPEGHIVTAPRKGYTLNGKLLRAAQVVVSSGLPAGTAPAAAADGTAADKAAGEAEGVEAPLAPPAAPSSPAAEAEAEKEA